MRNAASTAAVLVFAAAAAFGSDGKLTTTYRDPQVGRLAFNKIVVAFISPDADLRRRVEDGLARRVRNSVAARTIVPDADMHDRAAVAARLASSGVDGAIVVRLVSFDRDVDSAPGQVMFVTYPNLWDTWGSSWALVETPGYATMTKVVTADIAVFDVATTKPVWSGRLKSVDPKSLRTLLDALVEEGATELRKQKLL
jgi:hypothetical protein